MFKRSLSVLALVVVALGASAAVSTLGTTEAAAAQRTIWSETDLQQTASTYWNPALNQPQDYTSPIDLAGGTAYMRLDVLSKPSDMYVVPMICFWRHGAKQFQEETCAAGRKHPFVSEGTYWLDLGSPANWWKKNGKFDWSKPVSVGRIMIRDGVQDGRLLLNQRCGGACYLGDDLDEHVPITMSSTFIFVPKGQQLTPPSNWKSDCPTSWSSQCRGDEPTPVTTEPSEPTSTTAPPATTAPGPATIDVVPGTNTLQVAYRIPGAKLYQVRSTREGASAKWTPPTNVTSQTLTGLKAGKNYLVEARGLMGGSWQDWISTTTATLSKPGDPVEPPPTSPATTAPPTTASPTTTVAAGDTFIEVVPGQSKLDVSYHVSRATLYQVRYRQDGQSQQWTDATKATSQTLRSLKAGKNYTVEVRGLVAGTWGSWISTTGSPTGSPGTSGGSSSTKPVVEVTAANKRITVSWTLAGATTFQFRSKIASKSGWTWQAATTATSTTLRGLTNGTKYDLQVRALVGGTWRPWVSAQATPRA